MRGARPASTTVERVVIEPSSTILGLPSGGTAPRILASALLVSVIAFVALSGSASARKGPEVRDLEAQVEALSEDLRASRQSYDAAAERARSAAARESALSSDITSGRLALAELGRSVERNRARARQAGRSLARARGILSRRMVEIYMAGSPAVTELLLASGDFGALTSRSLYLEAIGDADRALAARVADLRRARVDALEKVRAERAESAARLELLEGQLAGASAIRARAEASASRLAALEAERSDEIGELRERVEEIEASAAAADRPTGESFPGGPYSIPTYIVMCESGGNYSALNPSSGAGGAYQIIPSTWEAYGGKGLPHEASKAEQDRIAALIWANDGPGAWVCS